MSISLREEAGGKVLVIRLGGKLTKADYERFVPEVERLIRRHGKIRMLIQMHDFHGWTLSALWEDIKFDAQHFADQAWIKRGSRFIVQHDFRRHRQSTGNCSALLLSTGKLRRVVINAIAQSDFFQQTARFFFGLSTTHLADEHWRFDRIFEHR